MKYAETKPVVVTHSTCLASIRSRLQRHSMVLLLVPSLRFSAHPFCEQYNLHSKGGDHIQILFLFVGGPSLKRSIAYSTIILYQTSKHISFAAEWKNRQAGQLCRCRLLNSAALLRSSYAVFAEGINMFTAYPLSHN